MKTHKAYQTIQDVTLKRIIILLVMIFVSYGYGQSQEEINQSQLQERSGQSQEEIKASQLQERTGVWYKINSETPYTGLVFVKYPNGQKQVEFT